MFSRARVSGSLILLASLALLLLTTACAPGSAPAAAPTASSLWGEQPDAQGNYYAGNPQAKVVVEEWSDVQ